MSYKSYIHFLKTGSFFFVDPLLEEEASSDASFLACLHPVTKQVLDFVKERGEACLISRTELQDLFFNLNKI